MARKFKKRLAPKQIRSKEKPVLSVSLIRKESLDKINGYWKGLLSKIKKLKLAN